jgi:hypothetical protein
MIRKEININTGEEKIIQLTENEISELNIRKIQIEKDNLAKKTLEADVVTKKASGKQKLLDLGLTEEEVKALIGI